MNVEDGAGALLSVTCCGSESASSPRVNHCAASLLFSLQFYVNSVVLTAVPRSAEPQKSLLLGFQLLQYEIVMFDASLECSKGTETRLHHGKSCIFEADPDELVRELRQDAEAPLTLLLLLQEHGRARLQAFGAVPLCLHVGLLDDQQVSHKISEWGSYSGSWELRDHHNVLVGNVTGAVTLSCLGKALAPHLTKALGVQVNKSQLSEEETAVVEEVEKKEKDEEEKIKVDAGVQCDVVEERAPESTLVSSLIDRAIHDAVQVKTKTKSSMKEGKMLYYKRNKGTTTCMSHRSSRESTSFRTPSMSEITSELLFPRELPPPLFFQKGAKS